MRRLIFIAIAGLGACAVEPAHANPPREDMPIVDRHPHRGAILTGVIRNAATHEPVGGASLDITSPALGDRTVTVQTGRDGRYTTEPVPPGEFAIRVRRDGFDVIERRLVVGNTEARLDIELAPR
jgi:hypothetical protein